jgi:hypothetical protein
LAGGWAQSVRFFSWQALALLRLLEADVDVRFSGFPTVSVVANSASAQDVEFGAFHATVGA